MKRTATRIIDPLTNKGHSFQTVTVPVTPREQLHAETLEARSPLDALVRYCDRHAWHTATLPAITHPPVPMDGVIFAADRCDPPVKVRVTPVAVTARYDAPKRGQTERTVYYGGQYRITSCAGQRHRADGFFEFVDPQVIGPLKAQRDL